jgi:hypothetical protein
MTHVADVLSRVSAQLAKINAAVTPADSELVRIICDEIPHFDHYVVFRAGAGEIAVALAALGRSTIAANPDRQRTSTLEALADVLVCDGIIARANLIVGRDTIPAPPVGSRTIGIARNFVTMSRDNEAAACEKLQLYDALLISPRTFLFLRDTVEMQDAARTMLEGAGFSLSRMFLPSELALFEKAPTRSDS